MALSREVQERSQIFNALNASQVGGRIWQVQDTGQILQAKWIDPRIFRKMKLDKAENQKALAGMAAALKENSLSCGGCGSDLSPVLTSLLATYGLLHRFPEQLPPLAMQRSCSTAASVSTTSSLTEPVPLTSPSFPRAQTSPTISPRTYQCMEGTQRTCLPTDFPALAAQLRSLHPGSGSAPTSHLPVAFVACPPQHH